MEYFAFQWHITDSCDQRCQHCYIFSEDNFIKLKEMSWEEIESVLENCMDMCKKANRLPYFYITGGDPILHSRFWDLMALLKENNIPFTLLGNPFHLNDEVCKKLKTHGCERYQLSIDGMRETHDAIRMPGSFDTTLAKIACLRNAGIRCAIMTTVSGTNVHEIPEIIDTVVKYKADIFSFARYCPTSTEKITHLSPQQYHDLLESCWEKFEQYKDSDTSFNLKDHLWTLFLYEKGLFKIPDNLKEDVMYDGCNCANCHMTILPKGEVYACRRFESEVANVFNEKLYDVFTGDKMNEFRQYDKFEKCSKCELLRFCRGCPAVTYGYTGNFYGADPQCWKTIEN
ncbi:radical SAM/SPASM domain protein, ACGX system [Labilibaculum manganireducens]|uniref:Radical SAM/SPASM domain protein, ACGX system n=1 Tax=Labilibaculum manganireducens TaxID=1940525 RepID=A0A2N3I1F3_9BACT|nr:radical SAM/SPASM domain protein, ACGX system [Labilibaculum manganireducens]PKQ64149.1 radical SAM/SPASM domain protein, ACGX system [Labilibaculum manganireducens]